MERTSIENIMPPHIKQMLSRINKQSFRTIEELRFRVGKPVIIYTSTREHGLNRNGLCEVDESYIIRQEDIENILKFISGFSVYALEDELRQGYLTIAGGHRIGVTGKVVMENQQIKTLKDMNGLNIRVAHQVLGCSDKLMPYILKSRKMCHTLIVSPPKCGKTTILRDIIRNLSNGFYGQGPFNVGVVDERSEIAGCFRGVPQNDIGIRTDVLDGCPKVEGMRMLIRSMAPEVLAVDEIGSKDDFLALEEALGAGVSILCTVHGQDLEDCYKKPILKHMLQQRWFERIIILSNKPQAGTVRCILDANNNFEVIG